MDEREFFSKLEWLICAGLKELVSNDQRCLWCDGLIRELDWLSEVPPRIEGRAWMGGIAGKSAGHQERWAFVLLPDPSAIEAGLVNWEALDAASQGEQWLSVDVEAKKLVINLRGDRGACDASEE